MFSLGVFVRGVFGKGGFCPGGFCKGGFVQEVLSLGLCPGGFCLGGGFVLIPTNRARKLEKGQRRYPRHQGKLHIERA